MQNHFTVRGVPTSLAMDGWWLNCSTSALPAQDVETKNPAHFNIARKPLFPIFAAFLLVLLADFLFWQHNLGLSLLLYAFAIFGVSTLNLPAKQRIRPTVLLLLGGLPVVEYVQLLSLVFLCAALLVALVWAHGPKTQATKYIASAYRLLITIPFFGARALLGSFKSVRADTKGNNARTVKRIARNWAFPIGGSLVFLTLLMDANPIFAQLLSLDLDFVPSINRVLFWLGMGLLIWPLIEGIRFDDREFAFLATPKNLPNLGLNAGSVLRALVMFNLLIGVQTLLDLSIFTGGTALPDGMTYASYAHRGAYPLVVTALLAGAFAIAARPFLGEHRWLKPLLMLWLLQNTVLCFSAGLRLDLYIEAYGLTYLRIRALIWMGVVAIGLSLTAWQILKAYSNRWLVLRCASLAVGVLYICCFVNFAALIATVNIMNDKANANYLCDFGPTAARAIQDAVKATGQPDYIWNTRACGFQQHNIDGWRDWGVRKWRTHV
ncbi:DUF4153 domain-containing protein [Falsihalocynthiibacter sp. S25ZX9]|uniref:DUF4153 domain-containing protein n=1 Tax=Falsihalocynthiibacter sp. S25ZX9 TaxID=3240870 RepID=UPI00350F788E